MANKLDEKDWTVLLSRIASGKCTPFLGAGASYGHIPLGGEIARQWAAEHDYPLDDPYDLPKVAQYVATTYDDSMWPKEQLLQGFAKAKGPDFDDPTEPHAVLARLPLNTYITTNYDPYLVDALKHQKKKPRREFCRWNRFVKDRPSVFDDDPGYAPDPSNPLVFHLHGHNEVPESLVLTEDDYLDFLVSMASSEGDNLPEEVKGAMGSTSLLFLGYSLADLNFRVLFRSVIRYLEISIARSHVSVQLAPVGTDAPEERKEQAMRYLDQYFGNLKIRVFWGTCREFMRQLNERWDRCTHGG